MKCHTKFAGARRTRKQTRSMNRLSTVKAQTDHVRSNTSIAATVVLMAASLLSAVTPLYAQEAADIYSQKCASCHGDKGKGDGPAAEDLDPKPKDFALSLKGKSDEWIAKSISGGGPAVGESKVMPKS